MGFQVYNRAQQYCPSGGPVPLGPEEIQGNAYLEAVALRHGLPEILHGGGDDDDWHDLSPCIAALVEEGKVVEEHQWDEEGNDLQQTYFVREWQGHRFIHSVGDWGNAYHHLAGSPEGIEALVAASAKYRELYD